MSSSTPRVGVMTGPGAWRLAVLALAVVAACDRATGAPAVTLWLAGDVHLGDVGDGAGDAGLADRRLAALTPLLAGAVGIVNLEGPVSERAAREGELVNHPARLAGLRAAGVIAVGVANNHAADGGGGAAVATVAALRAAGLVAIGGPAGPALLVRGGLRIVVTAHDLVAGRGPGPHPALADGLDAAALAAALAAARAEGDVLIATFHVTSPPSYLPPVEAVTAVALARAAGAAVIVVHGSHALARVERTATGVTAWGLGNLLFACACTDEDDGLILEVTVDKHGLVDAEVIPVAAGLRGAPARPAPDPALIYDLLTSLRSTPLAAVGARARVMPPAPPAIAE